MVPLFIATVDFLKHSGKWSKKETAEAAKLCISNKKWIKQLETTQKNSLTSWNTYSGAAMLFPKYETIPGNGIKGLITLKNFEIDQNSTILLNPLQIKESCDEFYRRIIMEITNHNTEMLEWGKTPDWENYIPRIDRAVLFLFMTGLHDKQIKEKIPKGIGSIQLEKIQEEARTWEALQDYRAGTIIVETNLTGEPFAKMVKHVAEIEVELTQRTIKEKQAIIKRCQKPQLKWGDMCCFQCGTHGHFANTCPEGSKNGNPDKIVTVTTLTTEAETGVNFLKL